METQEMVLHGSLSTDAAEMRGEIPDTLVIGVQGPVGPQGIPGVNPHIGANGNWYVGTTDTGVPATGPVGPVGPIGEQGIPGMTPHIGANGNWYIGSYDTCVPATGPAGADGTMKFEELTDEQRETLRGATGPAGEPGKDGVNGKDGKDGVDGKDGKDGVNGKDGLSGYTPQKGVDYFTDADKAELVNAVLAALPIAEGATF